MSYAAAICLYLEGEKIRMEGDDDLECYADCISLAIGHIKQAYELKDNDISSAPSLMLVEQAEMDSITEEEKQLAETFKQEGNSFLAAKKYEEALERYNEAIKIMPKNAIFWSNKAACFLALEDWDKAIMASKNAIKYDSKYAKGYGRLATALQSKGDIDASLESFMKALSLDPSNSTYQKTIDQLKSKKSKPINNSPRSMSSDAGAGGFGGLDFASLMKNPDIMKMANEMMSNPDAMKSMMNNPQMGQMMKNMMGSSNAEEEAHEESEEEAV